MDTEQTNSKNRNIIKCYDSETEVLTDSGFKLFKDVKTNENVWTFNPTTCHSQWQKITKILMYDYIGDIYVVRHKYINLVVTPNHYMWTSELFPNQYKVTKWESMTMQEVANRARKKFSKFAFGCLPKINNNNVCVIYNENITKIENFRGYVYNVEIPNHIIFVRRNGKTSYCGDTRRSKNVQKNIKGNHNRIKNNYRL